MSSNVVKNSQPIGLMLDGRTVTGEGRSSRDVINPATSEGVSSLTMARESDLHEAAEKSVHGFKEWSRQTPLARAQILKAVASAIRRDREIFAAAITREQGKTLADSRMEVASSADLFEWLAEEGKRVYGRVVASRSASVQQLVLMEPIGPVAAFSPWNFPLAQASRKIAHALAAGCSIVLKPAEEAPSAPLHLAALCIECGVPASAVQVVYGDPAMVSKALISSPHIRKISFTGSIPVGRMLSALAGEHLKKATLELGGNSPVIVMNDIDVDQVARLAIQSKFRNAGQICVAPSRFFVHDAIFDRFTSRFAELAASLRVGDGDQDATEMGPLAHARRIKAMEDLTQDAVTKGAKVLTGGAERMSRRGFFWSPTVLADVPADARILEEETFGPVAPFTRFDNLEAVLDRANEVEHGLAGYAFTKSLHSVRLIQDRLKAGAIGINTFAAAAPEMPFTGIKNSGLGVIQGTEGLAAHMNIKSSFVADPDAS